MSSETRKYELKARAQNQRETHDRIARAAAELHEEKGVARTSVAEIARAAGVSRLTVYNHFADLSELLPACAGHYERDHPFPDLADAIAIDDLGERVRTALARLYGWYREVEPMFGKLFSDRSSVPELERFMSENIDRHQEQIAAGLAPAQDGSSARLRALARLAVDYWTWRRLTGEGLDDEAAAELMASTLATCEATRT